MLLWWHVIQDVMYYVYFEITILGGVGHADEADEVLFTWSRILDVSWSSHPAINHVVKTYSYTVHL